MSIIIPEVKADKGSHYQIKFSTEERSKGFPWEVLGLDGRYVCGLASLEQALSLYPRAAIDAKSLQTWRWLFEAKLSRRKLV